MRAENREVGLRCGRFPRIDWVGVKNPTVALQVERSSQERGHLPFSSLLGPSSLDFEIECLILEMFDAVSLENGGVVYCSFHHVSLVGVCTRACR